MLVSRILTALFLLPLVIAGILYLPTSYFAIVVSIIFSIGAYEWTKISIIHSFYKPLFIASTIVLMGLFWLFGFNGTEFLLSFIFIAVVFWLVSLFFISQFPSYKMFWSTNLIIKFLVGYILLLPSWYALVLLKDINLVQLANIQIKGSELVLLMMFMIWSADTGAYFSGRKWGKTKLIVNVSPGKTRAGVYGAVITTCCLAIIFSFMMFGSHLLYALYAVIIATLIVIVSVIGDLFESMYKRNSGIKDSGNILPGHGGILDRIDSLTSVAPVFYTIIYFLADTSLTKNSIGQL